VLVTLATDPGTPGWPNEDFAAAAPGAAVLLDGATTFPPGTDNGCAHGVAWYARTLGTALLAGITAEPPAPLDAALAGAIGQVRAAHEHTCDLRNPATPAATVTAARAAGDVIELLAVSDSSIAADLADGRPPQVITGAQRGVSADPAAAGQAILATLPAAGLRGIALLSDGATRIIDKFGLLGWAEVLQLAREEGPAAVIGRVRDAEDSDPGCTRWRRLKPHDDATVVYWHRPGQGAP
jgi:hypothetical protein